jgi:hypothetical protein
MYKLAVDMSQQDCALLAEIVPELMAKHNYLASFEPHDTDAYIDTAHHDVFSVEVFPQLPRLRQRGVYEMDKQRDEAVCEKVISRRSTLSPGVFTILCEHGICYGFKALDKAESPDVPFSIFKTRFKEGK